MNPDTILILIGFIAFLIFIVVSHYVCKFFEKTRNNKK